MKGIEIINQMRRDALKIAPDAVDKIQFLAMEAQMKMFDIHARALGATCECMGMQVEGGFDEEHFSKVMVKWRILNEKGEPLI